MPCERPAPRTTNRLGGPEWSGGPGGGTSETLRFCEIASSYALGCAGLNGDAVGSCTPLPPRVIDSAAATGHGIAATVFGAVAGASIRHDLDADVSDPQHFYDLPYPSDLRLRPDGSPDVSGYPIAAGNPLTTSLGIW